jgi:hypothetical protein
MATSHTRLEALDRYILRSLIGRKGENIQVHSNYKVKVYGSKEIIMDEESTWIPKWQIINNVSWFVGICVRPSFKR